jgi:hypothetical protein
MIEEIGDVLPVFTRRREDFADHAVAQVGQIHRTHSDGVRSAGGLVEIGEMGVGQEKGTFSIAFGTRFAP